MHDRLRQLAEGARWSALTLALAASVATLAGGLAGATHLDVASGLPPRLLAGQLAFDMAGARGAPESGALRHRPRRPRREAHGGYGASAAAMAGLRSWANETLKSTTPSAGPPASSMPRMA